MTSTPLDPVARRRRMEVLVATWVCYAGFYVTRKVFSVVKAPLKESLGVDDLQISHLWTTYLVTYMLGQFLAAWLGRRYGSRAILIGGMSVSVGCNLAMGLVTPMGAAAYAPMLALLAVQGFAQATGWPHTIGIVAQWTQKRERGTIMSFWATCYQLGAAFAKWLAAFLFGFAGILWTWWGSAAILAAVVGFFVVFGHERPTAVGLAPIEDEDEPRAAPTPGGPERDAGTGAFLRVVLAMGLIYFGFKFLRYALDSWSALILREHFHLTTELAGYYSTAFDWIGFLGVIASGPISDRLFGGQRVPVILAMATGCFFSCVLLYAFGLGGVPSFVFLLGLTGFMAMGPDALLSGAGAMDVGSKRQAATAAGIINGVGSVGPIVQEPIIGWLKTHSGLGSVFALLAGVAFLAAAGTFLFWLDVRRRPGHL